MQLKVNVKKVSAIIGICCGVITISGAIVSGLGIYYGIPEIKSSVKEIVKDQREITKDVSEIKGLLKKSYISIYESKQNEVVTNHSPIIGSCN